jgi:hypothetical protein
MILYPRAVPVIVSHDAFLLFRVTVNLEDRAHEQTSRLTSILPEVYDRAAHDFRLRSAADNNSCRHGPDQRSRVHRYAGKSLCRGDCLKRLVQTNSSIRPARLRHCAWFRIFDMLMSEPLTQEAKLRRLLQGEARWGVTSITLIEFRPALRVAQLSAINSPLRVRLVPVLAYQEQNRRRKPEYPPVPAQFADRVSVIGEK